MTLRFREPPALSRGTAEAAGELRRDAAAVAAAWADPSSRALLVADGETLVRDGDAAGIELVFYEPDRAPAGERYLVGRDGGVVYFAVALDELPAEPPKGARTAGLREAGAALGDRDAGLLTTAVALQRWHESHTHCPRCGAATEITMAGHVRVCPADGSQHFPRVDPAVIMLVHGESSTDGRAYCLLGHQAAWPDGRYSTLAGFVEPGESLEQAVRREVAEEVGIEIDHDAGALRYAGSQPWPFPRSIMLGFFARAARVEPPYYHDGEMSEARWFTRAQLRDAIDSGGILAPGGISIARRLIESWLAG